jgi:hypothetical protein
MPDEIISRETIARLADNAAARWVANHKAEKPTCPFDLHMQPDAFKAWKADFERQLVRHSAQVGRGWA